jgi:hypothetical protein
LPAAAKGDVVPQGVLIPLGERTLTRPMATNPCPGFCSFPLGAGVAPPAIISNGRRYFGNVPIPASAENKKGPLLSDPCRLKLIVRDEIQPRQWQPRVFHRPPGFRKTTVFRKAEPS